MGVAADAVLVAHVVPGTEALQRLVRHALARQVQELQSMAQRLADVPDVLLVRGGRRPGAQQGQGSGGAKVTHEAGDSSAAPHLDGFLRKAFGLEPLPERHWVAAREQANGGLVLLHLAERQGVRGEV